MRKEEKQGEERRRDRKSQCGSVDDVQIIFLFLFLLFEANSAPFSYESALHE